MTASPCPPEVLKLIKRFELLLWVLNLLQQQKLLKGKTVGVDSTTLEADPAMKSRPGTRIGQHRLPGARRKDSGEDWKQYLTRLMQEEGLMEEGDDPPNDETLRKFDKSRPDKKVSNDEWTSPTDPDARIAKMKDGTTHLAYKAEHVVDLETGAIVAAEIYHANYHDTHTLEDSLHQAQINLAEAGSDEEIVEAAADKGYHSNETLTNLREHTTYRTYIPEPELKYDRVWIDKPPEQKAAVYANRRRTRGKHGKKLQRLRSALTERTFAHVCETGGARRTWLTGIENVRKRYLISAAAHNLGLLMRSLFKMGTPRGLQQFKTDLEGVVASFYLAWLAAKRLWKLLAHSTSHPNDSCASTVPDTNLALVA